MNSATCFGKVESWAKIGGFADEGIVGSLWLSAINSDVEVTARCTPSIIIPLLHPFKRYQVQNGGRVPIDRF